MNGLILIYIEHFFFQNSFIHIKVVEKHISNCIYHSQTHERKDVLKYTVVKNICHKAI